ncbi:MAG: response regulator transcription factor [Bacteroidetes bacterium]|nr:response regulator transcription factor [Bacteroidota bacterium]
MDKQIIHLAILDDHQIVIDGLKLLLHSNPELDIVAEANSAEAMLEQLNTKNVDVILTDITMPHSGMSGFEFSLKIKQEKPQLKILALSMSEEGGMIARMIDIAKVNGYIPKSAGQQELLTAIKEVAEGRQYFSANVLQQYEIYQAIKNENEELNLTPRELEIIKCLIKHYSNKQIADELFISERTVETHRKNIYRKTNTKGEASLIQFILKHNLLS